MSKEIVKRKASPSEFREGIKDGIPISLGYFAVAFTLGIAAQSAGLTAIQATICSLTNNASAGQYAGITVIAADAAYIEIALVTFIANARYLLMSCAMSQKMHPGASLGSRLLVGFAITDELFGIAVARKGYLNPTYYYGAMTAAMPGWALGTFLGVVAGNILPLRVTSALSVALFGMFLAVIIQPARKSKVVAGLVAVSFAASFAAEHILSGISSGTRTIILTVVISGIAALIFPHEEAEDDA